MRVTVIMPVYNKAPYLKEAIDSILGQTYTDFELLLIDDCSTDDSLGIMQGYNDPRIRLEQNEQNLGPGGTMNKAIQMAQGEYLVRLDADDWSPNNRIEVQVAYMDVHPEVGVCSGQVQCFGADNNVWNYPLTNDEAQASFLFTVPICQGASIIRKSVLVDHNINYGDVSQYIGEDRVLWFKLRTVTQFGNVPEIVLHYRRGEQNIAHDERFNRKEIRDNVFRFFFNELGIEVSDEELQLHHFVTKDFDYGLTATNVQKFKVWLERLRAINSERHLFPTKNFEQYLNKAWDSLFYKLPPYGSALVNAYFNCSKQKKREHVTYYRKYRINRLLGRAK